MSTSDQKPGKREFRKTEHRPWKTSLLETTVQGEDGNAEPADYDLNLGSVYADFNLNEGNLIDVNEIAASIKADGLKAAIQQTQLEKTEVLYRLQDRTTNPIMLGGFFQPQKLSATPDTPGGKKIHALLSDLKSKEDHLNALTRELEMSETKERIEQAELTRKAEAHSRLAAEQRMRQAIEQAQMVTKQFRLAMEQTNQTAVAHQEEERLRLSAEETAKEAKVRANNAELAMQNERLARRDAEEKMHIALAKAENTSLLQQQLHQTKEILQKTELSKTQEENRRLDLERHYAELNGRFIKMEAEYKQCLTRERDQEQTLSTQHRQIFELQKQISELENEVQNKYHSLQQKVGELSSQRDKLKEIILSEQQLRRVTEQKLQEAQQLATQADQARQAIEQRAKRAIEHASRTVMHILNTPMAEGAELNAVIAAAPAAGAPATTKPKITVQSGASPADYSYTEEDFKF